MGVYDNDLERMLKESLKNAFETDGKIILPTKSLINAKIKELRIEMDTSSVEIVFPIYWKDGVLQIGFEGGNK